MNIDDIPDQFEALLDRARAALDREITKAKNAIAALNAEEGRAQTALSDLQAQCKQAKAQLTAVLSDLHRSSGLVGLNTEISAARKTLEGLKRETAEEAEALAKVTKQRTERQAQVIALDNEVSQLAAVRAYNQEVMAKLRHQIGVLP
jgi:chromosome segregation ATPase